MGLCESALPRTLGIGRFAVRPRGPRGNDQLIRDPVIPTQIGAGRTQLRVPKSKAIIGHPYIEDSMATIDKVDVSFDRPSAATGGLQIRVSRWRHKLSKKNGDSVEFSAKGTAMDHMEISWAAGDCPFTIPNNVLSVSAGELRSWINARVAARFQQVFEVVIVDDLPRSTAGKTLKRVLRDEYASRGNTSESKATA